MSVLRLQSRMPCPFVAPQALKKRLTVNQSTLVQAQSTNDVLQETPLTERINKDNVSALEDRAWS